jgi:hypothetical protein
VIRPNGFDIIWPWDEPRFAGTNNNPPGCKAASGRGGVKWRGFGLGIRRPGADAPAIIVLFRPIGACAADSDSESGRRRLRLLQNARLPWRVNRVAIGDLVRSVCTLATRFLLSFIVDSFVLAELLIHIDVRAPVCPVD